MDELELTLEALRGTAKYKESRGSYNFIITPAQAQIILDHIDKLTKENHIPARAGRYLVHTPDNEYAVPWFNGVEWVGINYKPTTWMFIPDEVYRDTRWERA